MNDEAPAAVPFGKQPKHVRRATFTFEATLDDVSRVAQALRIFLPTQIPEESKTEIELGVVEAMTNIVKHGYHSNDDGVIEIYYDLADAQVTIELRDQGTPIDEDRLFGPSSGVLDFDPEDLDQLPEGGLGIAIIQATFDQISYQSDDGANTLRLTKTITPSDPQAV